MIYASIKIRFRHSELKIYLQFLSPAKSPKFPLPIIRKNQEPSISNRFSMPTFAGRTFLGMFTV